MDYESMPALPIAAGHKVTTPTEQKLKLAKREAFLDLMISRSANDKDAKLSFENELAALRKIQAHIVPDEVIQQRCERLISLCQEHNIHVLDNRAEYRTKNAEAVAAEVANLCGGAA